MRTLTIRKLSGLTLAALLLVPALPTSAQDDAPTAGLHLNLEAALEAQRSSFGGSVETEAENAAETTAPEINLSELRAEAWALDEGDDDPTEGMKAEKRGFGRWLKKHWYVPVLAAVALGVAFDSGDDDAGGEDD